MDQIAHSQRFVWMIQAKGEFIIRCLLSRYKLYFLVNFDQILALDHLHESVLKSKEITLAVSSWRENLVESMASSIEIRFIHAMQYLQPRLIGGWII